MFLFYMLKTFLFADKLEELCIKIDENTNKLWLQEKLALIKLISQKSIEFKTPTLIYIIMKARDGQGDNEKKKKNRGRIQKEKRKRIGRRKKL